MIFFGLEMGRGGGGTQRSPYPLENALWVRVGHRPIRWSKIPSYIDTIDILMK